MAHIDRVIDSINKNIKDGADFAIDSMYMHEIIQNWDYNEIIYLLNKIDIKNREIIFIELTDTLINLNKLDIFKIIIKKFLFSYKLSACNYWRLIIINHIKYGYDSYLILLKYMHNIGIIEISFDIYEHFATEKLNNQTKLFSNKIFI